MHAQQAVFSHITFFHTNPMMLWSYGFFVIILYENEGWIPQSRVSFFLISLNHSLSAVSIGSAESTQLFFLVSTRAGRNGIVHKLSPRLLLYSGR